MAVLIPCWYNPLDIKLTTCIKSLKCTCSEVFVL